MLRKIKLYIKYSGGGIEKDLIYEGDTEEEIAKNIMRDENALLEYMETEEDHGVRSFVFQGFMFKKDGILAAQFAEPDY